MRRKKRARPKRLKRQSKKVVHPSAAERERISERRGVLLRELIYALVLDAGAERDRLINQLIQKYGPREVVWVMEVFQKSVANRELIGEAGDTIVEAFEQEKVDTSIIERHDLDFLHT